MTTQARILNGTSNDQIRTIATEITGKAFKPLSMIKKEVFPLMTKAELAELKKLFLERGGDPTARNIQGISIPKAPTKAKTVKAKTVKAKMPLFVKDTHDFTNGIAPVAPVVETITVEQATIDAMTKLDSLIKSIDDRLTKLEK